MKISNNKIEAFSQKLVELLEIRLYMKFNKTDR